MGSEEEEPNLSEDLLTVREEQSGLFPPRLEHIKACTTHLWISAQFRTVLHAAILWLNASARAES